MKKIPPQIKIYEAFSCLADHRIQLSASSATIQSSNQAKVYTVKWKDNTYTSNDNATFWQGYAGYPVISVFMLQNKIKYNHKIVNLFKNINWHEINEEFKRNYALAIASVLEKIAYNKEDIEKEVENILKQIENLDIEIKRKIVF